MTRPPDPRAALRAAECGRLPSAEEALALARSDDLPRLMGLAEALTVAGHGRSVTYSRKVFIPLTKLCRDVCHYCTFAHAPRSGEPAYLTREQVLDIARKGAEAGCKEALFTLGDKPELRYRKARTALAEAGHATTLDLLHDMAGLVLREAGLLPHLNPGVMSEAEVTRLRDVSVSQGIMLETTADRLSERGGPHFGSPDKTPEARLATIDAAGRAGVPFTTGVLIGIGETRAERIEALLAIRDLHERHGHIQDLIIQNFRAKPGTRMARAAEPSLAEQLWTIAVARIVLGPAMSIQAPPNLQPNSLAELIAAGINDWGGVSPVTPDHVNPEAPWPHLDALARATEVAGRTLVERLAIMPAYGRAADKWVAPALRTPLLRQMDGEGFAREDCWAPGTLEALPAPMVAWLTAPPAFRSHVDTSTAVHSTPPGGWALAPGVAAFSPPLGGEGEGGLASGKTGEGDGRRACGARAESLSAPVARALEAAVAGRALGEAEIIRLFSARGADAGAIVAAADRLRAARVGETVTYVVNRNINYTNVCTYGCKFCAFSKGRHNLGHRDKPYDLDLGEIAHRTAEAAARGATEVCLQGGIKPGYTGDTYLGIVGAVKSAIPDMHVHAFSPLEIWHGATSLQLPLRDYLARLRDAGLGSLPGTAAEILDDEVRAVLCPDKITTDQWLEVMRTAHAVGLRSTATIMFGHVDGYAHWARHLIRVRDLQRETGGFTEFVPLPFVHMEAPIYLKGGARKGPTFREAVLMHAVARLALDPHITNIQASWVKMGPAGAKLCLAAGANDLGGVLMNESITRAAGAAHGQELTAAALEDMIRAAGRIPRRRSTLYADPPSQRIVPSAAE